MSTNANGTEGAEGGAAAGEGQSSSESQEATFTQADVDRIIGERLVQQAKNKFGDYDALKAKAEGAKTLEERLGTLESELNASRSDAVRTGIAARFKVSTEKGPKGEPSDADLFLTGTDEATLTAQAERLAAREADRQKQGNFAPKEGTSTSTGEVNADLSEFAKKLFNKE